MPVTAADIEAEHHKALDSLSKEQRWALYRVQRAYQESHFNHRKIVENLEKIFEAEAQRRNEADSHKIDPEADADRATD